MKTCKKCGIEKDESEFNLRSDTGKYRNECRTCCNKRTNITKKAWRERKKSGNLIIEKKCLSCGKEFETKYTNQKYCCMECAYQYIGKHSEAKKKSSNLRYIRDREKIREYDRLKHIKNREERNKRSRKYLKTPKGREVSRNNHHKRRVVYDDTDITTEWLMQLNKNTKFCVLCNEELYNKNRNLDHIIPINIGGRHIMENVRFVCASCNNKRPKDGSDILKV